VVVVPWLDWEDWVMGLLEEIDESVSEDELVENGGYVG
jgi:hypothetical protein